MVYNREKAQVLLFYPKTGADLGSTVAPPHALLTVAAPLLKAGYKVKILDQRVEAITEDIIRSELCADTVCVGITTMVGSQVRFALQLAEMTKRASNGKVPIVWGGCLPSVIPEQTIKSEFADCVVIGEGDLALIELVRAWEHKQPLENILGIMFSSGSKVIKTPPRPLCDIESLLPTPWELINVENYVHREMYIAHKRRVLDIGQTSRGCPFNCSFCSSASIRQQKWRPMSVEKSLNLILDTVRRFNLDGFWLRDDEFYIDRERANQIFLGIIRADIDASFYTSGTRCDVFMKASEEEVRVMRRAGAHTLKFGAESGSQRILDFMHKGINLEETLKSNLRCKKHGITPAFSLMIGFPTETFDDINMTIGLCYRLKRENPQAKVETIGPYTALPGTSGWSEALRHGLRPQQRLQDWADWVFDDYDFSGKKIPWFSKRRHRVWIGNINYMSVLSNSLCNAVGSIRNLKLRWFLGIIARPVSGLYTLLLRKRLYKFRPELGIVRRLRRKLFYNNLRTIK